MGGYLKLILQDSCDQARARVRSELPWEIGIVLTSALASATASYLLLDSSLVDALILGALVAVLTLVLLPPVVFLLKLLGAPLRIHHKQAKTIAALQSGLVERPYLEYRSAGHCFLATGADLLLLFPLVILFNPAPDTRVVTLYLRLWKDRRGAETGEHKLFPPSADGLGYWERQRDTSTAAPVPPLGGAITLYPNSSVAGYLMIPVGASDVPLLTKNAANENDLMTAEILVTYSGPAFIASQCQIPVLWASRRSIVDDV
jgi:hypothetical protein